MGHRQKGKHMKRKKSWHRGRSEYYRWTKAERLLDDVSRKIRYERKGNTEESILEFSETIQDNGLQDT